MRDALIHTTKTSPGFSFFIKDLSLEKKKNRNSNLKKEGRYTFIYAAAKASRQETIGKKGAGKCGLRAVINLFAARCHANVWETATMATETIIIKWYSSRNS